MESNPLYTSEGVNKVVIVGLPCLVAYVILRRLVPKVAVYILVALLGAVLYFEDDVDAGVRRYWPPPSFHADMIEPQTGKVFLVTGGNVGLGRETALVLAEKGATVVIGCRSNWEATAASITRDASKSTRKISPGGRVIGLQLDLADSASIYAFVEKFKQLNLKRLDSLILNAGVMTILSFTTTKDGLETQIGTNWIGHFYLQRLLEEELIKSAPSRVVIVSAKLHEAIKQMPPDDFQIQDTPINHHLYGPTHNYAMSKLLNIMHAKTLSDRLKDKGVAVVSLHPGVIDTSLSRYVIDEMTKLMGPTFVTYFRRAFFETLTMTSHEGTLTQLWAATAKEVQTDPKLQGAYFRPQVRVTEPTAMALDKSLQLKAWNYAESLTAKFPRKQ